jgi:hypothetical protein
VHHHTTQTGMMTYSDHSGLCHSILWKSLLFAIWEALWGWAQYGHRSNLRMIMRAMR